MRQCVSPLPSVRFPPQRVLASRSQSLVPGIYLLPFPSISLPLSLPSDDNRILSERALARAISRPICSFLQEDPPPSHHASRTPRGFRTGRSSPLCRCVFSRRNTCTHIRTHTTRDRAVGFSQGGSTRTAAAATAATMTMAHAKASRRRYETGGYLFPCYMGTLSSA